MEDEKDENQKTMDERIHQQMIYKDNRIIDLNNVILDKERQIIDLQEKVREHGEVAQVKNKAMRIVQQKFEEMNKERRDMGTETDTSFLAIPSSSNAQSTHLKHERRARSSSPGYAVAYRNHSSGTFSPPPVDPPVESEFKDDLPDVDGIIKSKKNRKRVTFDLPHGSRSMEELETALGEASTENNILRTQLDELNNAVEIMKVQYEGEIAKYQKELKTAGLKARIAATARIKELESSLETLSNKYEDETGNLNEQIDTLRNSRDWGIEQNGILREQIDHLKEKTHKLTEELDSSEKARRQLDDDVIEGKKLMDLMIEDLLQAENIINYHENQKEAIFEDIDRLKDAITAQDRFIEILEADIVIYEQHIGILRESLGASKVDHRALIKSKAFETKLLALEKEKDMIDKKSNEERLKTKALDKKCRVLVEQNEQLMAKICEFEMHNSDAEDLRTKIHELEENLNQISSELFMEKQRYEHLNIEKCALEESLREKASRTVTEEQKEEEKVAEEMKSSRVELEESRQQLEEAIAEAEALRAENFDLQMIIKEREKKDGEVVQQLELALESANAKADNYEQLMKDKEWQLSELTNQNEAMRIEVESARKGLEEANDVRNQVKELKEQLDRQIEYGRKQYEEAIANMESTGNSRKNSLEVQYEQYTIAFEQKIEKLQKELDEAKKTIEKDKGEKKKLKLAVKQLKEKVEAKEKVEKVEEDCKKVDVQLEKASNEKQFEEINNELVENIRLKDEEIEKLKKQIEVFEVETRLSEELNVELGRAMLDLEKQNDLLKNEQINVAKEEESNRMELRLHEMLVEEMSTQMEEMKKKLVDAENVLKQRKQDNEQNRKDAEKYDELVKENEGLKTQVKDALEKMEEIGRLREQELDSLQKAHFEELREISIAREDCRREICDLEVKLEESEALIETLKGNKVADQEKKEENCQREEQLDTVSETNNVQETIILQSSPSYDSNGDENNLKLIEENRILRECVDKSTKVYNDVSSDLARLYKLKEELETAVDALKAEIWSLNGQLKAQIIDRENLEDKIAELDSVIEKEKKKSLALDVELQEQVDLTDKALRRAAEAENESNRRLAECLEMEGRREELEKAYANLTDYYNQLQTAYNNVYAQLYAKKSEDGENVNMCQEGLQQAASTSDGNGSIREIEEIVTRLLSVLKVISSVDERQSTKEKLEMIVEKIERIVVELEETRAALAEQKKIDDALKVRLETLEAEAGTSATTNERVEQLEGEIEWKIDECEGLKRRINELEHALDAIAERATEDESAKLATRQADVDSLFRTNAELAHTNVGLQNDVDDMEEKMNEQVEELKKEKEGLTKRVEELEEEVEQLKEKIDKDQQGSSTNSHEIEMEMEELRESEKTLREQLAEATLNLRRIEHELEEERNNSARSELEGARRDIQRLEAIERKLKQEVATLEKKLEEAEDQLKQKNDESTAKEDNEWGWEEEQAKESSAVESGKDEEIERLRDVEKVLNKRIAGLEEQLLEVEEKLQEAEEEIFERKNDCERKIESLKKTEEELRKELEEAIALKKSEESDWGWEEDEKKEQSPVDTQKDEEIERLKGVENVLNKRVSDLEQQLIEVEEKLQEAEDEMLDMKKESVEMKKSHEEKVNSLLKVQQDLKSMLADAQNMSKTENASDSEWGWGEDEAKSSTDTGNDREIERLRDVEKVLKERVSNLEEQLLEMEEKLKEAEDEIFERKNDIQSLQKTEEELRKELEEAIALKKAEESDWGWEVDVKNEESPVDAQNDEEIDRLKGVENVLNKRVSDLEQQLIEVEEKLQEAEDEMLDMKKESAEMKKNYEEKIQLLLHSREELKKMNATKNGSEEPQETDDWGWGEEEARDVNEKQKKDEIDLIIGDLERSNNVISEQQKLIDSIKNELVVTNEDRQRIADVEVKLMEYERMIEEKDRLIQELEKNKKSDHGWDENDWGDEEKGLDDARETVEELNQKIEILERQIGEKDEVLKSNEVEMKKKHKELEQFKESVDQELEESNEKIQKLYKQLAELQEIKQNDDEVIDGLRMEMNELQREKKMMIEKIDTMERVIEDSKKNSSDRNETEGWDDDGWGEQGEEENNENESNLKSILSEKEKELERIQSEMEVEIKKREAIISQLGEELSVAQDELLNSNTLEANGVDEMKKQVEEANRRIECLNEKLKQVSEQNELLKDSEARLIDHADEYANQMEMYKEECEKLRLEVKTMSEETERMSMKKADSDELVTLRQSLTRLENEQTKNESIIGDRDRIIEALKREITELKRKIEELNEKLRVCDQHRKAAVAAVQKRRSRPSSRLSTSSKVSNAESVTSVASVVVPSQGSAFELVPSATQDPIRRRNK